MLARCSAESWPARCLTHCTNAARTLTPILPTSVAASGLRRRGPLSRRTASWRSRAEALHGRRHRFGKRWGSNFRHDEAILQHRRLRFARQPYYGWSEVRLATIFATASSAMTRTSSSVRSCGVRYEHTDRLDAERSRLRLGAVDERLGRDEDGRDAAAFEVRRVVHTARRAASSVGERFDDRVAPRGDLVPKIHGRRLGKGGFLEALHGGP